MRRTLRLVTPLLGALLVAGSAAAAHAAGSPVESWTEHVDQQVSIEQDVHPCTGQAAELTTVMSGVIHFVAQADGTVHISGSLHGTFTADALPADGTVDATGSFDATFGGNGHIAEPGTVTGRAVLHSAEGGEIENADGTIDRWHHNGTSVYDGDGLPKLDFFREQLHCS